MDWAAAREAELVAGGIGGITTWGVCAAGKAEGV